MQVKTISLIIIGAIILSLGVLSLHWYMQHREQALKDDIANRNGRIEILEQKATEDSLKAIKYQKTIDSAKAFIHLSDTILISKNHAILVNKIKTLSADSSIEFLRSRLK